MLNSPIRSFLAHDYSRFCVRCFRTYIPSMIKFELHNVIIRIAMDLGRYTVTEHKLEGDSAIFTLTPKPPEIIDSKNSDECIEKGICTFKNTGKQYSVQLWYQCQTCNIYCCIVCKEKCHGGHQMSDESKSPFFCDCGAENATCKALSS